MGRGLMEGEGQDKKGVEGHHPQLTVLWLVLGMVWALAPEVVRAE